MAGVAQPGEMFLWSSLGQDRKGWQLFTILSIVSTGVIYPISNVIFERGRIGIGEESEGGGEWKVLFASTT